jgi:hypothetical protein
MGGGISHKRDVLICECALFNHVVVNLKTANDAKPAEYYTLQLTGGTVIASLHSSIAYSNSM